MLGILGLGKSGVAVFDVVGNKIGIGIVWPGLEQQDRAAPVLGQSSGQHASGRPAADDHDVVFHASSFSGPTRISYVGENIVLQLHGPDKPDRAGAGLPQ